jgi:hypothetical protein
MDTTLRPMNASQVLDRTFQVYRNNFVLFAGIALVLPVLRLLASSVELAWLGQPPQIQPGQIDPKMIQALLAQIIFALIAGTLAGVVGNAVASGTTAYAVSMVHLGRATTIVECYKKFLPLFWRVLGLTARILWICLWPFVLSYALIIGLGLSMVALQKSSGGGSTGAIVGLALGVFLGLFGVLGGVVWFFYAYCRYALAVPACVVENLGIGDSLRRSKFLSEGSKGRVLGVYLLTGVMAFVLTLVLQLPVLITQNVFSMSGPRALSAFSMIWLQIAQFLGTGLAGPIAAIAMALVYYDERVRKEAFDLHMMMQAMPETVPPPVPEGAVPPPPSLN